MTHGEAAHERGTHNMFTGYRPSPALTYPSFGSVVSHEFGPRENLPPYVCLPKLPASDAGAGYLGSAYGPFTLGSDPASDNFTVRDLSLPGGVDTGRFSTRQKLRDIVGRHFQKMEDNSNLEAMDEFYARAYDLVGSARARAAFDITAEPAHVRDQYGRNQAGQRMLLARRLVGAGVRFIEVKHDGWDHHKALADEMSEVAPVFDQAFATLITDLEQRGMLDSTLVVVATEFGRKPAFDGDGRSHHPVCFSTVLAGGGTKAGFVYGKSDDMGYYVDENAVSVGAFHASIAFAAGMEIEKPAMSPSGRPMSVGDGEKPILELFA